MPRRPSQAPSPAVEFSHVEKVYFPKGRFTKGDLIKYYLEIAPTLLPHLRDRPVTLKRFPEGIHGPFFYEKDAPGYTPEWVPTFPVPRREGGEPIHYILINDARVLAWCANLGTIELHPFLHRAPAIQTPTAIAFDFDPGDGADLRDCAKVALRVRALLEELKLQSFPKVSGSKGLQLYVPLNTPTDYDATQGFAKAMAELLHRRHPKLIVSEMAKELRRDRVFIDWSQNSDFKTTVGVYSLRAKREAPFVSLPVTWEEVEAARTKSGANALNFSPAAALQRVADHGDLFAPVLTLEQQLPVAFADAVPHRNVRAPRALEAYEEKRDFRVTPEPDAAPRRSAQGSRRRFVIQKHAASHLHYDFRLEMGETLKSWAVPKGLPYVLDERHSAFATEDHPLGYLMFEGIIPAGQYGGGTVMVWDVGTYDVIEGNYWKGYLRIFLRGKKLKGEWTLNRVEERDGKARWLVSKSGEPMKPLSSRRDDQSAASRRSMAEIAAAADAVWESNREPADRSEGARTSPSLSRAQRNVGRVLRTRPPARQKRGRTKVRSAKPAGYGDPALQQGKGTKRTASQLRTAPGDRHEKFVRRKTTEPDFVEPMMARAVATLPEGPEWSYEVKWDGYRALAIKHGDVVRLFSRKGNRLDQDFPGIVEAVRPIHATTAVLDGEIVALDENGRPQFQLLQNRASTGKGQIVFYAYDLLQREDDDLKPAPLERRKAELTEVIAGTDVRLSADLPGTPAQILTQAARLGLEGIVAKQRHAAYQSGERSGSWVKLKLSPEQEFVIGGYKPGKPLESLLVGYYEDGKLLFAGKVRQGLNPQNRVDLWRALTAIETEACPFANIPNSKKSHFGEGVTAEQMKELRWTKPQRVAQVSFTEWTSSGNLRHATYLGLRTDKRPKEVKRETLAAARGAQA